MAEKRPLCIYGGQVKELLGTDSLPGGNSGGINYSVISENTNATTGNGYLINASAGNITLTLPGNPSTGDIVAAVDIYNKSTTNTITLARNGSNIEGIAEDMVFDINGVGFILVYADSTRGWEIVSEVGASVEGFSGPVGLFDIDDDGDYMPGTLLIEDSFFELDEDGDMQPL